MGALDDLSGNGVGTTTPLTGSGSALDQFSAPQNSSPSGSALDSLSGGFQFQATAQQPQAQPLHDVTNPWDGLITAYHGAQNDIGQLVSGIGKIAYTPVQVATNLFTGKGAFDNTIVSSVGHIATGLLGSLSGGDSTPEWEAIKSYYGQYGQHPIDMILNHPINTILDVASILDAGSTSAGAISKIGEVGDITKLAEQARLAGDTELADQLASKAQALQKGSTSGQIADVLSQAQHAINPFRLGGKLIGATFNKLGTYSATVDGFNNFVKSTFSRMAYYGLSDKATSDRFFNITDRFQAENLLKNQAFREEIIPALQPFVNNPALADRIADGLDRPSLLQNPMEISLRDTVQNIFNKYVTEPEKAGGLLRRMVDSGYLEHSYIDEEGSKSGYGKFNSFKVNAPNDKTTQILRFDKVDATDESPIIGTAKYNNLSEVNKDAEIEKIEQQGGREIDRLQKQNIALTKGVFDNQLSDLLDERKELLRELSEFSQRKIDHPEEFQTNMADFANALDIQEKVARQNLIENNLKLETTLAKLRANPPEDLAELGEESGSGKVKFQDPQDKLVYNLKRIEEIQGEISDKSKVYNTNFRLFKDGEGNLLKADRPTLTELRGIGMQPRGLIDALEHRAKGSFLNQTKLELGDQIGKEFGTLEKPQDGLSPTGEKMVQSKTLRTPQGQYYYVPESIENATKIFDERTQQGAFMTTINATNKIFKRLLFALPTSAVVHLQHLGYLGYLGGGLDLLDVVRQISSKGDAIDAEFSRAAGATEVKSGFFEPHDQSLTDELTPKTTAQKAKTLLNPASEDFLGAKAGQKALESSDDFLRRGMYRKFVRSGLTSDQAIAKVNSFMGNYSDITPAEKVLQAVFPFYGWMKRQLPVSARALTDQAIRLDIPRFLSGEVNLNPNKEEESGKFDSGQKDALGREIFKSASVPLDDIRKMFNDLPDFMWTRATPAITAPVSAIANRQQLFNSDPNFAKLNQVYDPNLDPGSKAATELAYLAKQVANPFKVLYQPASGENQWSEQALNTLGIYSSTYDPQKTDFYNRKDAAASLKEVQKQYNKAIKSGNLMQASFYQRAVQMWTNALNGNGH